MKVVGRALGDTLDVDFKTPKTVRNYKGDVVEEIDLTSVLMGESTGAAAVGVEDAEESSTRIPVEKAVSSVSGASAAREGAAVTASAAAGGASTRTIQPTVSRDEQAKWKGVLNSGELLLASGPVGKKNPMGLTQIRQLLLTNTPRLLYADEKSLVIKGEVECGPGKPIVATVVRSIPRVI